MRVLLRKPTPVRYMNLPSPRESGWEIEMKPWRWAIEVDSRKEARLKGKW